MHRGYQRQTYNSSLAAADSELHSDVQTTYTLHHCSSCWASKNQRYRHHTRRAQRSGGAHTCAKHCALGGGQY